MIKKVISGVSLRPLLLTSSGFFPEVGVDFQEGRHDEGHGTAGHDDDKEHAVAHSFLQCACKKAGDHHRQRHKGSTQRIMGGFMVTTAIINKV